MNEENLHLTRKQERELKRQMKEENKIRQMHLNQIKTVIISIIILISVIGVVIGFVKLFTEKRNTVSETVNIALDSSDWQKGKKDARITLVEYSDFQCPACALFNQDISKIMTEFGTKINFVYRHYPLVALHKWAYKAAEAAEAAGKQGKFWEMHDRLFETQEVWIKEKDPTISFIDMVVKLGLDKDRFKKDINSEEIRNKIDKDIKSGDEFGIIATPTFFLNGKRIDNIGGFEDFKKIIKQEVDKTDQTKG